MAAKAPNKEFLQQRIEKLKRQRAGKKGSITKRIAQLTRLVSEYGSRTKIKYLLEALHSVHEATKTVCEEISSLTDSADAGWIEEVNLTVDTCTAEVHEYLEARKDDASSESRSSTESWVRKHEAETPGDEDAEEEMRHLITGMGSLSTSGIPAGSTSLGKVIPSENTTAVCEMGGFGTQGNPSFSNWREPNTYMSLWSGAQSQFGCYQPTTTSSVMYPSPELTTTSRTRFRQEFSPFYTGEPNLRQSSQFGQTRQTNYSQPINTMFSVSNNQPTNTVFSNTYRGAFNPTVGRQGDTRTAASHLNEVDSWIDELDDNRHGQMPNAATNGITANVTMAWLVQQSLPEHKYLLSTALQPIGSNS